MSHEIWWAWKDSSPDHFVPVLHGEMVVLWVLLMMFGAEYSTETIFFINTALLFMVGLGLVQLYQGCRVFDSPQDTLKDAKVVQQHNQVRKDESYRPAYWRRYWDYNWLLGPIFPCVLAGWGFGQPVVITCLKHTPAGVWLLLIAVMVFLWQELLGCVCLVCRLELMITTFILSLPPLWEDSLN